MALERGLLIHSSCIWRWVQVYGPELDKRCRAHLKRTNKSYRVDETGSIAKLVMRSGRVEGRADHHDSSVQRAPFPGRGDSVVRPLVSSLSPRLRTRRRTFGGARRGSGPQLHLALG